MIETRRLEKIGEANRGSRRDRIPSGFLMALALIAAVEWAVVRPRDDLSSFIPASWSEAARAVAPGGEALKAEVLCLGDSQIKGGVLPSILEEVSGLRAYNLGTIGGQPAGAYYLLRRALASGAKPRALVIGFYPGLLASDMRINLRTFPEALGFGECLDLLRVVRDRRLGLPLLLRLALPSFRRRDEVRESVLTALAEQPDSLERVKARAYRRNWGRNAGAQALAPNPSFKDEIAPPPGEPGLSANAAGARWKPKPENTAYLRKLLDLARSREIAVFWLLPTNSPGLRTLRASNGLEDAYYRSVRKVQAEFGSMVVLDPNALLSNPARFSDACHVDGEGAVELSGAVARVLEERLVSSSTRRAWPGRILLQVDSDGTALANYRKTENLDESMRAVARGAGSSFSAARVKPESNINPSLARRVEGVAR